MLYKEHQFKEKKISKEIGKGRLEKKSNGMGKLEVPE